VSLRLFQHRQAGVYPFVDDTEVVNLGKGVLVDEMKSTLLGSKTFLITILDEAAICFLTFGFELLAQGVVVLVNVQCKEVGRWEVSATRKAPIGMILRIVNLECFDGRKFERMSMRREGTLHGGPGGWGAFREGTDFHRVSCLELISVCFAV
jgi:hypothetical protein